MTEYNKTELIQALDARFLDIDTETIVTIVDGLFDELKNAIVVEDRVEIKDFGTFTVKQRSAEAGTMPAGMKNSAGVEYKREADYVPEFFPAPVFYDLLNEDETEEKA